MSIVVTYLHPRGRQLDNNTYARGMTNEFGYLVAPMPSASKKSRCAPKATVRASKQTALLGFMGAACAVAMLTCVVQDRTEAMLLPIQFFIVIALLTLVRLFNYSFAHARTLDAISARQLIRIPACVRETWELAVDPQGNQPAARTALLDRTQFLVEQADPMYWATRTGIEPTLRAELAAHLVGVTLLEAKRYLEEQAISDPVHDQVVNDQARNYLHRQIDS